MCFKQVPFIVIHHGHSSVVAAVNRDVGISFPSVYKKIREAGKTF